MANLYIFLDESGNRDFSKNGTRYWVLTSLMSLSFNDELARLYECRHKFIREGVDLERFHASEDRQVVRDAVFEVISGLKKVRIDSVLIDKNELPQDTRPAHELYPKMVEYLLSSLLMNLPSNFGEIDNITLIMDKLDSTNTIRDSVVKGIQQCFHRKLPHIRFQISMHSSASHLYLQLVDYCSWALFRKWERSDTRSFNLISHLVRTETLPLRNVWISRDMTLSTKGL